jgi:hypothetical protein
MQSSLQKRDLSWLLSWAASKEGNRTVFHVILLSALIVVGARTLAPFEVGKDQSSQLEAAQNLAGGRGLTTTNDVPPASLDIIVDPQPRYLTWWPPGFSLILASFLALGFSLLISLKIIYALVTMTGWIGWGALASRFLTRPLKLGGTEYPVHLVIATLLPVFFTLGWNGTDIFLWAGIPFLLMALFKQHEKEASYLPLVLSGLLFGVLYSIRYSSLFLALAALLILLQVRFPAYRSSLIRFAIFLLAGLFIILPTYLYGKFYAAGVSGISDRATFTRLTSNLSTVINGIFIKLPITANLILGTPVPDQILFHINYRPLLYVSSVVCLAIILGLPILLIESCRMRALRFQNDLALSIWLLPLSLLGFLIATNLVVRLGLIGVRRYYEPLALCGLLVFYQFATVRLTRQIVKRASCAVVLTFVGYVCVFMPALAFLPERRGALVDTVVGFVPPKDRYRRTSYNLSYPSSMIYSPKESSKQKLRQLAEADPKALFFVEEYACFTYDRFQTGGPILGKTMRVFPEIDYWRHAHTSAPVKIYWVVNDDTNLSFVPTVNQKLVFSDKLERTKILLSSFPSNYRFVDDLPNHSLLAVSKR